MTRRQQQNIIFVLAGFAAAGWAYASDHIHTTTGIAWVFGLSLLLVMLTLVLLRT